MNKIIGIRGHRGAGKTSVAYLLGNALELLADGNIDKYDELYEGWVKGLIDGWVDNQFNYVYIDSFGDAPKAMVQQLLGCDFKYLWEDGWKDKAVVNLKTFDIEEVIDDNLISIDEIQNWLNNGAQEEKKILLRDFILYFGQNVMQNCFGKDVWVKSTSQNDKRNEDIFDNQIRIYEDIKAPTELSYIINKGGKIINVERNGYKKKGGLDLLKDDDRWDYCINIKGDDLMSIKEKILNIAKEIYIS